MRSGWGLVVAGATVVALTSTAQGPARATLSTQTPEVLPSVFVSPTGSDTRSCKSRSAACASFNRAYQVASAGEIVEVAAGTYPEQIIVAAPGKKPPRVVFQPAPDARVILDGLSFGTNEGYGPKFISVRDMETTYKGTEPGAGNQKGIWVAPGSSYVELVNMDAGSIDSWLANHLTVKGGDYGPCRPLVSGNICGNNKQDFSSNVLIEGTRIHDFDYDPSNPGAHWECMYINGGKNVTIRGNRFQRCAIFDILLTISGEAAMAFGHENLTIENNFFAPALDGDGNPTRGWSAISSSWCHLAPQPAYRNVKIRNNSFAAGAGIQYDQYAVDVGCQWQNVTVTGNLLAYGRCQPGWTYAYNVFSSGQGRAGKCAPTDISVGRRFPYQNEEAFNYHLQKDKKTRADGLVPASVAGGCPRRDIDGQRRPLDELCDAGADERRFPPKKKSTRGNRR